jgi:NTP pyrophosphatase (non-canonical NTP hydrolase)
MDFNEYQRLALRTYKAELSQHHLLINGALGLTGEAGEVADIIKKHAYPSKQGDGLDTEARLLDELGDVLWYLAILAQGLGVNLETTAAHNIAKLVQRHNLTEDTK